MSEGFNGGIFREFIDEFFLKRWEFKHPTPFLRTREFLWQEGLSGAKGLSAGISN